MHDSDRMPENHSEVYSSVIGPFDAGKAILLGMFLPSFIARSLGVSGYWLQAISALGLPAVAIYLTWSKGLCLKKTFYLRSIWDPDFGYLALFSAGLKSLTLLVLQTVDWLTKGRLGEWMEWFSRSDLSGSFMGSVLVLAVLVPITEELLFRGFSLTAFSRWGQGWAVVFPSIIFALFHLPVVIPGAFIIGVVAAMAVVRYHSIIPAVLMHAAGNLLPQLIGKYHDLVKTSWAEIFCTGARLALVVSVFVFRHKFVWLWHEFRRLWQEFTESPQFKLRFKELMRQWPWVLVFTMLGIAIIGFVLIPHVEAPISSK